MRQHRKTARCPFPRLFGLRFLLALAGFSWLALSASADNLILQRFVSENPDAELESVLYLTAGVALADLGYSSAEASTRADYILTATYSVRGSEADIRLSLADARGMELAFVDASLHLGLSFDVELSEAIGRLVQLAALDSTEAESPDTSIGGLFTSELITVADTLRTKKTVRVETLTRGGGMYFVGDFSSYAIFGAGASLDAGVLFLNPRRSFSAGLRTTATRAFMNAGVEGGALYLSTAGLDLQFGVGAAQSQRLSAGVSGGAAFITVAGDSGALTKTVPYADAGIQAGFPLGNDFFLGGDLRFMAIFEGNILIMAVAPAVSLCKEF